MNLNKLKIYQPSPGSGSGGGSGAGGGNAYVRASPTTISVGGMPAGTLPQGSVQDVLDKMFYPYQNPAFSLAALDGWPAIHELGQSEPADYRTFRWACSQGQNVQPDSVEITDLAEGQFLCTGLPVSGTASLLTYDAVHTIIYDHQIRFAATNTHGQSFGTTLTFPWRSRRWAGTVRADELGAMLAITSAAELTALTPQLSVNDLIYAKPGASVYDCSGNAPEGRHVFFLWDSSLGLASFTSGAAPAAFRPVRTFLFTNQYWVQRSYNLYVSSNPYNGSSVQITVS